MKIGLLIYGSLDTVSGGYFYDRKLVEYLHAHGETVEIVSLPWRNYALHLSDNIRFRLPTGLDLLIQDELNHPSLLCANAGRHKYPVISLIHHLRSSEKYSGLERWFYQLIEKKYLGSVDGYIYNSNTTRNVVTGLVNKELPSILANPPTDRFGKPKPTDFVIQRATLPGPLRIVFVGNIIPRKGLDTLLQAIHLQQADFTLEVIGSLGSDPVYAREIRQLVRDLGLSNLVTFYGALETQGMIEILEKAHVLVVPSSYEGFGIVYLEGMAFGLPAIGTTAGAAAEIIQDGQTGFLIRPGDVRTLGTKLADMAGDRELLGRLSVQALERYGIQPAWEETADRIHKFLYQMLENKK